MIVSNPDGLMLDVTATDRRSVTKSASVSSTALKGISRANPGDAAGVRGVDPPVCQRGRGQRQVTQTAG